ncbi:hypothetical protein [Laceyella putida]|uniref:DUF2178 domain-containing protein n=1 Tax=Laceyella putida TaxID=110101 RepID=A0ABW2RI03_9BACL
MQEQRRQALRQRQLLYLNGLFVTVLLFLGLLLLLDVTAPQFFLALGLVFLVSPISIWVFKESNPLLSFLPGMQELTRMEREKLGESWGKYHLSSALLQVACSLFFFVQAWMRSGDTPFREGMPTWYFAVVPMAALLIINLTHRSHVKRMDNKTPEQLRGYAYEKMLFSVVFASVMLGMTLIGTCVVMLMT